MTPTKAPTDINAFMTVLHASPIGSVRFLLISPRPKPCVGPSHRLFPLGFRRQSLALPVAILVRVVPGHVHRRLIRSPHLADALRIARRRPGLAVAGGKDELLVPIVGHFIAVDRERLEMDRSLRLFVESAAHRASHKRSRGNGDHIIRERFFIGRRVGSGRMSVFRPWRGLFVRSHDRSAENTHDGKRSEGEDYEEKGKLEFGFEHGVP